MWQFLQPRKGHSHSAASLPIVVGIDGSKHAIRAAIWANDEAVSRDTGLRLVHVVDGNSIDLDRDYAFAEDVVHKAWKKVENFGKPVKVESDIRQGDSVAELVEVSRKAEMICVEAKGAIISGQHKPGVDRRRRGSERVLSGDHRPAPHP